MKPYRFDANLDPMAKEESSAWSKIEYSFRSARPIAPRRGFADRWLKAQHSRDLVARKHRDLWLAIGNGTAILVILGVIAITLWPTIGQPASLFAGVLESLLDILRFVAVWFGVGLTLLQKLTPLVWFMVAMAFFGLIALWTVIFSRAYVESKVRV